MEHDRRTFLKTAGIAGIAALSTTAVLPPAAQGAPAKSEPKELPKGMAFATLRRGDGYGLGLRTQRGVLDVAAAEAALKYGAPTTITTVLNGHGDVSALKRLAAKAADRYFVAEDKAKFGPAVTDPEKIVCIGLNYRRHAAKTGNPVPKMPILFNKYNSALNCCGGTIAVSKEKATKLTTKQSW